MKEKTSHSTPSQQAAKPSAVGEMQNFFEKPGKNNDSSSFFTKTGAQAKLQIGAENDPFEKEADAMADKIVNKQHTQEQEKTPTNNTIQKKEEEKKEEGSKKQIQKKSNGESSSASPSIQSQLNSTKGGGQPLSESSRQSMESGFGNDFSNVRVHSDSNAAQMNKELGSHAFTHGNDIYFNEGKYNPGSRDGDHLLAHELTHTIQQTGNVQRATPKSNSKPAGTTQPVLDKTKYVADIVGPKYMIYLQETDSRYLLDTNSKELTLPGISLPNIKHRNAKKFTLPILSLGGDRPPTNQSENWKNAVRSAVNEMVTSYFDAKKINPVDGIYYLRLRKHKDFHIIGKKEKIQELFYNPGWNRKGDPNSHQVDHIVEMQLGGADQPGSKPHNYELLDSKANSSAGSNIKVERHQKIKKGLKLFEEVDKTDKGKFPKLPTEKDVLTGYINSFAKVDDWKLSCTGDGEAYWDYAEITEGKHLNHLKAMTENEIKEVQGSEGNILIYLSEKLGKPKRFKGEFKKEVEDYYTGMDLIGLDTSSDQKIIEFRLNRRFSKRMKTDKTIKFDLIPLEDRPFTYYIKTTRQFNRAMFTKFEGASPIELNDLRIDDTYGLALDGTIKSDLPLLNGLQIDFTLFGNALTFNTTINTDIITRNFPKLFNVSNSSLTISYTSADNSLALQGNIDFEVEKLGKGNIVAGKKGVGFFLTGDFLFDKSTLDGKIHLEYDSVKGWSMGGSAKIPTGKIKGVKDGSVNFKYANDVIEVGGQANLSVPGIKEVIINSTIGKDGNFVIAASAELSELPGIKGGTVHVTISQKKGEDLKLGVEGKVTPNFPSVPDMNPELKFYYFDGLFDVRAKVEYKKGRFKGLLELGVTNRTVDEKGQLQGEPQETNPIVVFGYGELTVELFKNATGKVGVRLTPDSQVLVNGEFLLQNLMPFGDGYNFTKPIATFPKVEIPLIGIPGMSISAFIQGGVNFNFNWQPLVLKVLRVSLLETNINEMEKARIEIQGEVGSFAQAELIVFIDAGLKARVLIATLSGSIGGEAGIGVKAEAGGKINAAWDANKGLQFKEASIFLNVAPFAIFRLTGKISVDLDLWVTTVNLYYKKWVLAEKTLDLSGMELNINFPLTFNEDNTPVMPPYEKMNIQQPDLTGQKGKDLMDNTMNGDAKKEEEAKKQEIRNTIRYDLRTKTNEEDFSPSKYKKSMVKKYGKSPELKEFVLTTIDQESLNLEYEKFEVIKNSIRSSEEPLSTKLRKVDFYTDWIFTDIRPEDVQAFKNELIQKDIDKKLAEIAAAQAAAEEAARIAEEKKAEAEAVKEGAKNKKKPKAIK